MQYQASLLPETRNDYEKAKLATHAYLGIHDGTVQAICVDIGGASVADFMAEVVRAGGFVERVALEIAKDALFEPWPLVGAGDDRENGTNEKGANLWGKLTADDIALLRTMVVRSEDEGLQTDAEKAAGQAADRIGREIRKQLPAVTD